MKKKVLCAALALFLVFSLSACGGEKSSSSEGNTPPAEEKTPDVPEGNNDGPEKQEENTPPANGGRMEKAGTLGNFDVEIKGAVLSEDYEGKPAIVITYSWTNNSEETTNVMSSMMEQAFQDGVEMDVAIMDNADVYDADGQLKDVRPGTTIDVQCAYLLTSETSVVEFEISEFLNFEDELVVMNFDPSAL